MKKYFFLVMLLFVGAALTAASVTAPDVDVGIEIFADNFDKAIVLNENVPKMENITGELPAFEVWQTDQLKYPLTVQTRDFSILNNITGTSGIKQYDYELCTWQHGTSNLNRYNKIAKEGLSYRSPEVSFAARR